LQDIDENLGQLNNNQSDNKRAGISSTKYQNSLLGSE